MSRLIPRAFLGIKSRKTRERERKEREAAQLRELMQALIESSMPAIEQAPVVVVTPQTDTSKEMRGWRASAGDNYVLDDIDTYGSVLITPEMYVQALRKGNPDISNEEINNALSVYESKVLTNPELVDAIVSGKGLTSKTTERLVRVKNPEWVARLTAMQKIIAEGEAARAAENAAYDRAMAERTEYARTHNGMLYDEDYERRKKITRDLDNIAAASFLTVPMVITSPAAMTGGMVGSYVGGALELGLTGEKHNIGKAMGLTDDLINRNIYTLLLFGTSAGEAVGGAIGSGIAEGSFPKILDINLKQAKANAIEFVTGGDRAIAYEVNGKPVVLRPGETFVPEGTSTLRVYGQRGTGSRWGGLRTTKGSGKGARTQGRLGHDVMGGRATPHFESQVMVNNPKGAPMSFTNTVPEFTPAFKVAPGNPYHPYLWTYPEEAVVESRPVVVPVPETRKEEITTVVDPWAVEYARQQKLLGEGGTYYWKGDPASTRPPGYVVVRRGDAGDPVVERRRVAINSGYVAPDSTTYRPAVAVAPKVINTLPGGVDSSAVIDYSLNIYNE